MIEFLLEKLLYDYSNTDALILTAGLSTYQLPINIVLGNIMTKKNS